MKRLLSITIFLCFGAQLAVAQTRLEFTAHSEDKKDAQRSTIWAKECDGRMDIDKKEKIYMLFQDCGRTTIMVSVEEKTAVKMSPMQSSPAGDINTGVLFMQGKPQITIEKLEEKPGPKILGRATIYYRFKSVHRPDPRVQEPIKLIVEEEFWTDPTLDIPVLDGLLGKMPLGDSLENETVAFAAMKGLPLRHRTVVMIERAGAGKSQPAFVQEVLSISTEPFDKAMLQIPKGFRLVDMASGKH